jgi:hypothetical protein
MLSSRSDKKKPNCGFLNKDFFITEEAYTHNIDLETYVAYEKLFTTINKEGKERVNKGKQLEYYIWNELFLKKVYN